MPDIAIEQSTFERLQRHARPLLDTTDAVVNRALDALEHREGHSVPEDSPSVAECQIDAGNLPNLKHTKVLDASLEGKRVVKPNWNRILERILIRAMKQFSDFDELRRLCPVNMVRGRKEDEGYRYLAEIDVSVQGMSANDACGALVVAAQSLRVELAIAFMWRPREGAAHPGKKARLNIPSAPSGSWTEAA